MKKLKIGLFDSGVGGLTVLKEFINRNNYHDYIYFGDTLRVPYGNKSCDMIKKYSLEISQFLANENVDMIIIACGTATSVALDYLKENIKVPVIGVIEPTTKYLNNNKDVHKNIGVIGTKGTVESKSWEKLIDLPVQARYCPLFVPLIEEMFSDEIVLDKVIDHYLKSFKGKIDTLVLGCTHYPVLEKNLNYYFENKVKMINPGVECAKIIEESKDNKSVIKLYFSDLNDTVEKIVNNYLEGYTYEIYEKKFFQSGN